MTEGVSELAGDVVDVGEADKGRPPRPPDDPVVAPKGWTYDSKSKTWRPALRAVRRSEEEGEGAAVGTEPGRSTVERPDPDPARFAGRDGSGAGGARELSAEDKEEIKSLLGLAGLVVFTPIARADPHCGGALVEASTEIFEKLVPIIAKSDRVSRWMTVAGGFGDWIGLAVALKPVAMAVVEHHIFKTVGAEDQEAEDFARYVS
ncbi:MAG: hypothetical protein M0010_15380 [Actinomycetota bacterium]|nr:hypothetical protein [Actinomycetota bacterium]